jgi:hypothetical protein
MQIETRQDRVRNRTPSGINRRLDAATTARVKEAIAAGASKVKERLASLDREWDIDRVVMLAAALAGTLVHEIGMRRRRSFLRRALVARAVVGRRLAFGGLRGPGRWLHRALRAQLGFLGVYALLGWAPPVPLFRLFGCRTKMEIENERQALLGM